MNKELVLIKENVYAAASIIRCSYAELVGALARTVQGGISVIPMFDEPEPPEPPKGRRCRFSDLGRRELRPRHPWDLGWCIDSKESGKVTVKWDWQKSHQGQIFHRDFIEIIDAA